MNSDSGYVVFLFPQALEALGEPIKPYLLGEAGNEYLLCRSIDTAGGLIEMTLNGQTQDGTAVQIELMMPQSMVRMIVSAHGDEQFGFRPRFTIGVPIATLPPVGPTATPAKAPSQAVPDVADAPTQTPRKP